MLRSLVAVIVAVITGLAAAKFVEAFGQGMLHEGAGGVAEGGSVSGSYQALLAAGWFVGAFVASALALLIGKRWAPLGVLAAGTVLFAAIITQITFTMSWFLWPMSAIATAAGGFLALKALKATRAYPLPSRSKAPFSD